MGYHTLEKKNQYYYKNIFFIKKKAVCDSVTTLLLTYKKTTDLNKKQIAICMFSFIFIELLSFTLKYSLS